MDFTRFKPLTSTLAIIAAENLSQPWKAYATGTYGSTMQLDASHRSICPHHYTRDVTGITGMTAAIGTLPTAMEAIHCWIGGQHSMGHVIPAILELAAPAIIAELHVSTLTFSKDNASEWAALIDAGKIQAMTLFNSQYFEKTSQAIYQHGAGLLKPRNVTMHSRRIHAKLITARLSDGQTITAEGSANTRSCRTLEQVTLFGDPCVYDFHVSQLNRVATAGNKDRNLEKAKK